MPVRAGGASVSRTKGALHAPLQHRRLAIATWLFANICSISSAQQTSTTAVPNLIRYSGTLKDPGVVSLGTPLGVTFAIYKQQDGGAAVWQETQNVTPDASGQYSVTLGSTTATGLPGDLFSQQEQRWLGVQVQGQPEQARVLLVSVPYAFKAHEAETLGGKSVSDFMPANGAASAASTGSSGTALSSTANNPPAASGVRKGAASDGPTNFSGSTTDQIVGVTQNGTGVAVNATATTKAIVGTATAPSGTAYGVQGVATGTAGVGLIGTATSTTGSTYGLRGTSSSTSGTGVRGIAVATSGSTIGLSGYVDSTSGTAGVFNNAAGGKILSAQNNGVEQFSVDGSGNVNSSSLNLPNTSPGSTGVISLGGARFLHDFGTGNTFLGAGAGNMTMTGAGDNTAVGTSALAGNTTGTNNSALGFSALSANTTGYGNSAFGYSALTANTVGVQNTAFGSGALSANTTGDSNAAFGLAALNANTTGHGSSAFGYGALNANTTGIQNEAFGIDALFHNTTGNGNAAFGGGALEANTTGGSSGTTGGNVAFGNFALNVNTTGGGNAALGYSALTANTSGNNNVAVGSSALASLTTGGGNIAIGVGAGGNLNAAESGDIYVGNSGIQGESNTIRIGFIGTQTTAFMAGISGSTSPNGVAVLVNGAGQLGTSTSSRRFKHQIADMDMESDVLMKLRPVAFYYKPELDETQTRQYGLVAEEVAQVAPQLVVFDQDGAPQTVRYHFVNAMLLNEVQKQYRRAQQQAQIVATQQAQIKAQQQQIESLRQQLQLQNATLQERLSRLERLVETQTVAQK